MKAEQKAKEKLEKESAAQKKPVAIKKDVDATKSADISPNVNIFLIQCSKIFKFIWKMYL